jgi:hypothetical protein
MEKNIRTYEVLIDNKWVKVTLSDKLLVAAPELFEAIKLLRKGDCFCEFGIGNPMYKEHTKGCILAQQAIAKAIGEKYDII